MKPLLLTAILLVVLPQAHAFGWRDWWSTKNQQAQAMMDAGQFAKAQETFEDPAWKATAAFRAGHYKDAATGYQTLKNNPDAWYNLGNAMAHAEQWEAAIKAYDKALAIDPHHQDALHNRKIVEALLKKEKENKKNQKKQDQDKQDQHKQDQDKQTQDKQNQDKQDKTPKKQPQTQLEREQQQASVQWLRLIPDDPGGFMREKFLRDYLSRKRI